VVGRGLIRRVAVSGCLLMIEGLCGCDALMPGAAKWDKGGNQAAAETNELHAVKQESDGRHEYSFRLVLHVLGSSALQEMIGCNKVLLGEVEPGVPLVPEKLRKRCDWRRKDH
jgi:hypothetical protein